MRKSYFTCSYLAETDGGLIAIDAGMKSTGQDMLGAIAEIGRKPEDVKAILLTHWHNDHSAGAAELAERSGAEVIYHFNEAHYFTRGTAFTGLRAKLANLFPETGPLVLFKGLLENAPMRAVNATRHVRDGDRILDTFDVLETPGHTGGHVSFYDRHRKILFAGDALAVIDGRVRFMARPVTEDLTKARKSMMRCMDLPIDHICPGHREPLSTNVREECERMRGYIAREGKWPVFG
ncbi:MAG TPA: MBL fold metallo-hydrolase [Tepidisphaeraceae bacterium]|nr:MBL fold metallo-hydrolase [Tepidisphaeraceae bacterium]